MRMSTNTRVIAMATLVLCAAFLAGCSNAQQGVNPDAARELPSHIVERYDKLTENALYMYKVLPYNGMRASDVDAAIAWFENKENRQSLVSCDAWMDLNTIHRTILRVAGKRSSLVLLEAKKQKKELLFCNTPCQSNTNRATKAMYVVEPVDFGQIRFFKKVDRLYIVRDGRILKDPQEVACGDPVNTFGWHTLRLKNEQCRNSSWDQFSNVDCP